MILIIEDIHELFLIEIAIGRLINRGNILLALTVGGLIRGLEFVVCVFLCRLYHEIAVLFNEEVDFLRIEEFESARVLVGLEETDELEVFIKGLVDLLELLFVLELLTEGVRMMTVVFIQRVPFIHVGGLGLESLSSFNFGLVLVGGGVIGISMFVLQILQYFDEDGFDLRVLVEEGILVP